MTDKEYRNKVGYNPTGRARNSSKATERKKDKRGRGRDESLNRGTTSLFLGCTVLIGALLIGCNDTSDEDCDWDAQRAAQDAGAHTVTLASEPQRGSGGSSGGRVRVNPIGSSDMDCD